MLQYGIDHAKECSPQRDHVAEEFRTLTIGYCGLETLIIMEYCLVPLKDILQKYAEVVHIVIEIICWMKLTYLKLLGLIMEHMDCVDSTIDGLEKHEGRIDILEADVTYRRI